MTYIVMSITVSAPSAHAQTLPQAKAPIGMNLGGIADYTLGFPFKNLMWGARPWLTRNAEGGGPFNTELAGKIALDPDGYPLELPATIEGADQPQVVFTIIPNVAEPGRYVVLYDGEGEVTSAMSSKATESKPGRLVLDYKGAANDGAYEGIAIVRSTRGNHVRNIRIVPEAQADADLAANPFRDDFVEYCRQWHALRFMDWQATNNSLEKEWAGRKKPTFYTMVASGGDAIGRWGPPASEFDQLFSGGVALETIIQLANMIQVDPWVCVPHRATPEYMREMAQLFKDKLDPKLKVYVEYSNEVWNWQFQQAGWMIQSKEAGERVVAAGGQAWQEGLVPEFTLDNGAVAKDGGTNHPERMGALSRRCFEPWEAVFAGADRARLVRVVGVQHAWLDTVERTVKWVMANGGADAVSPAGYFGPNDEIYSRWETAGASLTAEQVIADMRESLEKDSAVWTRAIGKVAKDAGLAYLVYEGGQHIQPKGQEEKPYMPALRDAQFHQGMYDIYMANFAVHKEAGCSLFMAFSSISRQGTRYGSWGHQEYYGQPRSEIPKFGALIDANSAK
jgi:hypothetical protein